MAQHDYVIANGTGAAVRSDLNNALAAIVSQNSGATTPSTTYAYQWWADTTTGLLKLRNAANSAWITLFQLDGEWSTIALENGTAAAPSIYFKDSGTDTGFYSPGTDQVGISTGGTARLTIDSNGNVNIDSNTLYVDASNNRVGLGTSAPQEILEVAKTSAGASVVGALFSNFSVTANTAIGVSFSPNLGGTARAASIYGVNEILNQNATALTFHTNANGASQTEKLRITSAGLVGIGTTTVGSFLHLYQSGNDTFELIESANAGNNAGLLVKTGGNNLGYFAGDGAFSGGTTNLGISAPSGSMVFRNGASHTERARIDTSGRLLVGTSTSVDVGGGPAINQLFSNANSNLFALTLGYAAADGPRIQLGKSRNSAYGSRTIVQNNDELGTINFNGDDGTDLNTTGASIVAYVDGTPGANDLPSRLVFSVTQDGSASPTERMRIMSGGGIYGFCNSSSDGMVAASAAAAGTTRQLFVGVYGGSGIDSGGTTSFRVYTNGNVQNTNNSYGAISDAKLKENIVDAGSQWDDLKALQVRKYNLKEGQTHTQIGLVAQEAELVSPGLVYESPDRDAEGNDLGSVTKSVNYSVLYMKAVKALQEAMERIETLEAKVAALEGA